jgi:prepilin-type N-terminal cleavage/methylation domain-containing protein
MEHNKMRKSKGFSIVEIIIVVVIVGIIAALGIVGYSRWKQTQVANKTDTTQQTASATPDIKTTSDLDKALTALDQADVAGTDTTQLDSQSNSF